MNKWIMTIGTSLFLVVAGAAYAHEGEHEHCNHLPPEKKELLHQAMKEAHEKNKALFEKKHVLHEELKAILTAPKFDKEKFLAKQDELEAVKNKMKQNMVTAFASVAEKLSVEERKTLAESMHHWHHDHHGHHGEWHHHDEKDHDAKATGNDATAGQKP